MIELTVRPVGQRNGRYTPGFQAFHGERLICESRTPLLSASRILLAEGVNPETPISMSHQGSDVVSMRSTVGTAAGLMVIEKDSEAPRFAPYRPMSDQNAVSLRSPSPHTAIVGQDDGFPLQRENPFSDDHVRASA